MALLKSDSGQVVGLTVDNGGATIDIHARSVVNSTGVWADEVDALDANGAQPTIRPAKGVHVVVPSALVGNDVAVVLPVPGGKGSVFAVPWGDFTYVGTTDTDYEGDLGSPHCTADDAAYLLESLNASVRDSVNAGDIVGTWAGLRPLLRAAQDERTADLSRRHRITRSKSGVVTVAGGKLTTYRQMAEDTVDEILDGLGIKRTCPTKNLLLQGAVGRESVDDRGIGEALRDHLVARYGGEARQLIAMIHDDPALGEPIVGGVPYVAAEARFAVAHEMAGSLDDVLARRTLGWTPEEQAAQVAAYRASVTAERDALDQAPPTKPKANRSIASGWVPGAMRRPMVRQGR